MEGNWLESIEFKEGVTGPTPYHPTAYDPRFEVAPSHPSNSDDLPEFYCEISEQQQPETVDQGQFDGQ